MPMVGKGDWPQAEYLTNADESRSLIAHQRAEDRDARFAARKSLVRWLIERLRARSGRDT
jgi:hypothetical protein